MEEMRPRLGRGLAALIGDSAPEDQALERSRVQRQVPIEFLRPNPRNPRRSFGEGDMEDLTNSIREKGIIQPILVRTLPRVADAYEIIAGERRWRAAQAAHLHEVPIVLVEADDRRALEIAIIENVQRADLNALEEARGYEQLANEFQYSQQELAKVIGKSRSHIANTLRLLKLPEFTRQYVENGDLSAGHARALLTLDNADTLAKRIVEQGLSVRDVERLAQNDRPKTKARLAKEKDSDTKELEIALSDALGLIVSIDHFNPNGVVKIKYNNLEQLDRLCSRLK